MKPITIHMISIAPRGGFHHYSVALCEALRRNAQIESVHYVCLFREQSKYGIGNEEEAVFGSPLAISYIAASGRNSLLPRYASFFRNFFRFVWEIDRNDLVHIQAGTFSPGPQLLLMSLLKMRNIRWVITIHEIDDRQTRVSILRKYLNALLLRHGMHFIVHDPSMELRIRQSLGRRSAQVSVIPHGNYLGFRSYMPNDASDLVYHDNGVPTVLFFGTKRHKGVEVFLRAWKQITNDGYRFKAILAGTVNPEDSDLIEVARKLSSIEIVDEYIPNAELWRYFCRSSVVLLPYLSGATSGGIHLAYAFRRPVIASDIPCFKETVFDGRTGVVVRPGNATDLKNAIVRMCGDIKACQRMGEEGFLLEDSSHYAWDVIAERTIETYRFTYGA